MEPREIRKPPPGEFAFEISGGALCLDFVNTVENRGAAAPRERLHDFADLVAWSRQAGAITPGQAAGQAAGQAVALLRAAARQPAAARSTLRDARELRETICRIFVAAAAGDSAAKQDLAAFNRAAARAFAHQRLRRAGRGFVWEWNEEGAGLGRMLWPVLRTAADLLASEELARVRVCAASECRWLFLDQSKNQSRRWCNMKVCGNRAKARRFYKRRRAG